MGYAVLHLDKAKGADSGMSAHIERTSILRMPIRRGRI